MSRNAGKLKPYDFTFAKIYGRENLMPLRGLLIKHQILYFYLQTSSTFPALLEGNIEY